MKNQRYRPQGNLTAKTPKPKTPKPDVAPRADGGMSVGDRNRLANTKKVPITLARFSWDKPQGSPKDQIEPGAEED